MSRRLNKTADIDRDLRLLESLRWGRMHFVERLCEASVTSDESVLATLRLEATYQIAEFFFLLQARGIASADDIRTLAELHNEYIVSLTKDPAKLKRLGLNMARALDAMFTADVMPRLVQNWNENNRAIDQSNLARLLVSVMSAETCRKIVVACAEAGLLAREKSPYGTILVRSTGMLEQIFGAYLAGLRSRIDEDD